jgi:uridine kinase
LDVHVIGISGGSGSGKTTIVREIASIVPDFVFLPQDNYYFSRDQVSNFDHPSAFDTDLIVQHLSQLKRFEACEMPKYDFVEHRRTSDTISLGPSRIVIFEGIMIFFDKRLRELIDLKLFVDTPDDIRLIRRLRRDIVERGRTVDSVIEQYTSYVRPGHYQFVEPTKAYADLIVPEGGRNEKALEVLVGFIRGVLNPDPHA